MLFRRQLPVEGWNAQVSLLTGTSAARLMLDGGVGILRTLPPPRPEDVDALRRLAPALGVEWPAGAPPGDVISTLDGERVTVGLDAADVPARTVRFSLPT